MQAPAASEVVVSFILEWRFSFLHWDHIGPIGTSSLLSPICTKRIFLQVTVSGNNFPISQIIYNANEIHLNLLCYISRSIKCRGLVFYDHFAKKLNETIRGILSIGKVRGVTDLYASSPNVEDKWATNEYEVSLSVCPVIQYRITS